MKTSKLLLPLYRRETWATRAFLKGRLLLSDLDFIEKRVPSGGTVVDLGCGHGLFANLLALRSPRRSVIGIDLDREKIAAAGRTVGARGNIRFTCGDILEAALPACDVVTIVDVMYLLKPQEQQRMLTQARQLLKPGGLLVWKAQERRPRWKYAWTYFQELVSTSIGFTQGKRERFYFLSREEAVASLVQAGFRPQIVEMPTKMPYTDILYLGKAEQEIL